MSAFETSSSGPSQRQLKVAEQVRQILSEVLVRGEFHDALLERSHASIAEVRMSPDLRHAKVYVTSLMGESMAEVVVALNDHVAFFRRALSKGLAMKFLPKVRFLEDDTFYEVNKIQSLLSSPRVRGDVEVSVSSSPDIAEDKERRRA